MVLAPSLSWGRGGTPLAESAILLFVQPALFILCAGNELFYCLLYLFNFSEGPLGRRRRAGQQRGGGGPGLPRGDEGLKAASSQASPSPASHLLCIPRTPFYSWLCGSFPSGPLGHRPYRGAQVSHQCCPPDHGCPQHGCPGRRRPCQEEVTPEPPAPGCPPALGVSLGRAAPLSLPRGFRLTSS